ncbi:EAL domain-containing protein [Gallaecimonas kandeliae]|uniref:EAL domain-containing protein n=1 Tax=Gallaecimonas kandeliae TaxID=3029055 RepID=UPI00264869F7|nr:EAL domain-containing protein [Gallaecimonas kandeliae]WKE65166.1 EAL domain-containing protein [Gallaecimonas kandeliae]
MRRISLTNRVALLAVLSMLVTGILVQWLIFSEMEASVTQAQKQLLKAKANNLQQALDGYRDDVVLLASLDEAKNWLADQQVAEQPPAGVVKAMLTLMERTPDFFQARILSADGHELVRLDREEDGRLQRTDQRALQYKGDRDYVLNSQNLGAGAVYTSPLNLNREFGKIQIPYQPTVRVVSPIMDGHRRLGLAVLNVDFRYDLNSYLLDEQDQSFSYLVDEQGNMLVSPVPDESFAVDLGRELKLTDKFPSLRTVLAPGSGGLLEQKQEMAKGGGRYFFITRIDYGGAGDNHYWFLVRALPKNFLLADAMRFRNTFFLQLLTLMLVMFVLLTLGVRRLLHPLQALGVATNQAARGNYSPQLPKASSKEIQRLSDDFSHMLARLKEREAELTHTKDRFALFLAKVPCEVAIFDQGMRYIAASDDWIASHDLAGVNFKGKSLYELDPGIQEEWRTIHARCLRGEVLSRAEDSFLVDGEVLWLKWEVLPWFDSDQLGGLIVFQENITERKQLEASLQDSEALLRTTIENAPDGMAVVGADLRWQEVNLALCRELDKRKEDLEGTPVTTLLAGKDKEALRQQLNRLRFDDCKLVSLDLAFGQELDDELLLHAHISAVKGKGGQLRHYVFQMQNVTTIRRMERQQRDFADRLALATRAGHIGIWEYNPVTGQLSWDQLMYSLYRLDIDPQADLMARWRTAVVEEDLPVVLKQLDNTLSLGSPLDAQFRIHWPDGSLRYIRAMAEAEVDEGGRAVKVVGCNWDITESKAAEQALHEEKERLSLTLESIGDAVVCTDAEGKVTDLNHVAEDLLGWPLAEAIGKPFDAIFQLCRERSDEVLPNPVLECIAQGAVQHPLQDVVMVNRQGKRFDLIHSAAPVRDGEGQVVGALMVFQDMTRTKVLQRELSHAAAHDALTGLLNRAQFEQQVENCIDRVHRNGKAAQLCFFDLDRFKILNDSAGHSAGDALLVELGLMWRQLIRSDDILARLGGDEFGLLLEHCSQDKARHIAEEMLKAAQKLDFRWDDQDYDVSACVGIASITPSTQSLGEVMSHADVACYAAKSSGRAKVCVYSGDDLAQLNHQELMMASKLKAAIQEGRFMLYCQGMHSYKGDEQFVELLLRLKSDDGGVIGPAAFIPAAERYDLVEHLDLWVLDQVLGRQAQLLADSQVDCFFVNLSASSLSSELFAKTLLDKLNEGPLEPSRLCFEITETALINQMSNAIRLVQQIRAMGAKVAIDDFGSGLSSFAYLRHFQVDYIKIDGCFVQSAAHNPLDRTIISSISNIAHRMQAKSIAEWVEDDITATLLDKMELDFAQGFYFGRPGPLSEYLREQGDERQAALGYGSRQSRE